MTKLLNAASWVPPDRAMAVVYVFRGPRSHRPVEVIVRYFPGDPLRGVRTSR